jgi:hypothetical protein
VQGHLEQSHLGERRAANARGVAVSVRNTGELCG